jgi:tripartite-type tricarboxylate transporter receptor subunit TctC
MTTEPHRIASIAQTDASGSNLTPQVKLESRRKAVASLGAIVGAPFVLGSQARAQAAWPTRPVKYINPFPPGGATDILSRLFCAKMSEVSGQQWVVENIGGGGGDIGVSNVARAAPDGYTFGLGGVASHAISPTLKAGKLPFDSERDFTFVTNIWSLPNFLVGNLALPASTILSSRGVEAAHSLVWGTGHGRVGARGGGSVEMAEHTARRGVV